MTKVKRVTDTTANESGVEALKSTIADTQEILGIIFFKGKVWPQKY